ncbi:MAG: hypothetical protein AAF997_15065 [Myxococcota bacterium]
MRPGTWRVHARRTLAALTLVGMINAGGCATGSGTRRGQMSEAEEIAQGKKAAAEVEAAIGFSGGEDLNAYVNEIGQRLAKHSGRPSPDCYRGDVGHVAVKLDQTGARRRGLESPWRAVETRPSRSSATFERRRAVRNCELLHIRDYPGPTTFV